MDAIYSSGPRFTLSRVAKDVVGVSQPPWPTGLHSPRTRNAGRSLPVKKTRQLRVVSATSATLSGDAELSVGTRNDVQTFDAVCPICQQSKFSIKSFLERKTQPRLFCGRCSRSFLSTDNYTDLTLEALPGAEYKENYSGGVETFRSPLVSWAYERGWRQSFASLGFPGPDEETKTAIEAMRPAWGQPIMDLSCGSGLFTRRFLLSGKFSGVIASDFSENMLKQTSRYLTEDRSINPGKYTIVRLDAGRLPFATGSLAAVHAGAALHCWPNPALAVAEISRVLKPGGVFVASTILNASSGLGSVLGDDIIKPLKQLGIFNALDRGTGPYRMWNEQELREICSRMGLKMWQRERQLRFILFSVTKPQS